MSNTNLLGSFGGQAGDALMFRNRIINGDMRIDQRNAGTQSNTVSTQYNVDRWNYLGTIASKFTIQKSAVAPSGFTSSLLLTSSSAYAISGTADWLALRHYIEGFNVADLAWGTANAQAVSLSFWARSSLTGTFGGSIMNDASNRSHPFTYSISVANTWEYKTVVIPGDTSGTWTTDNTAGMRINFSVGAGTSQKSAAGSWTAGAFWGGATGTVDLCATNGATFYITGVQLEAGPTATPFERRPYSVELGMCQRYYYRIDSAEANGNYLRFVTGSIRNAALAEGLVNLPQKMRVTPTLEISAVGNFFIYSADTTFGVSTVVIGPDGSSPTCLQLLITSGALTAGRAFMLIASNNKNAWFAGNAEL